MALPPARTNTPPRTTTSYTVGDPALRADMTTAASAPNIGVGRLGNPALPTMLGADAQSASVAVGALADGASTTLTLKIGFPNLPTPIPVGSTDFAQFITTLVSVTSARTGVVESAIPGIAIAAISIQPQAFTAIGIFGRETLQTSTTYTGWGALVTLVLVAAAATAAGTATVRVAASLWDTLA